MNRDWLKSRLLFKRRSQGKNKKESPDFISIRILLEVCNLAVEQDSSNKICYNIV